MKSQARRLSMADPAVCFFLALLLFLLLLGHNPLQDWDEAIYADIAREFARGPSRVVPFWNFQPWLERTPLFEWLTAAFFATFGVTQFWARAGAAFSGAATVSIVFLLARECLGQTAAWLAAGILVTTPQFFWQSRFGTTDALLTLWMTGSFYGLYRITTSRPAGWYLLWIGLGLGIMTKSAGPAPVVVTALIVLWIHRRTSQFGRQFFIGLCLFLAIVVPWHLYMWTHFGERFLDDYLGRQILARSMRSLEGHSGSLWYYVVRIGKGGFPWSLLLVPALFRIFRLRRLNLVEIYAVVVFVFYTIVKTKLPWYITPFYPALAIIASKEIGSWVAVRVSTPILFRFACPVFIALSIVLLVGDVRQRDDRPELLLLKNNSLQALSGPLILCSDEYILDSPAPVFYANRRVVQAYVNQLPKQVENGTPFDPATNDPKFRNPLPLSSYVTSGAQPILLDRALQQQVSQQYTLRIMGGDTNYVLGAISRHS